MLVTSIVAGVDTYQGMNCARRTGGYIDFAPASRDPDFNRIKDAVIAVPYGVVRGVIYNFGQAIGAEGTCSNGSYALKFGNALSGLFNSNAPRTIYLLNQAILGAPGAAFGGVVAEEFHVFGQPPAKVAGLSPS